MCFFSSIFSSAQVGINTLEPTSMVDVNGDLRIRGVDVSQNTENPILVIDPDGNLKRSITSQSYFRGYLNKDFTANSGVSTIHKITDFKVIDQASDEFDTSTNTFTPTFSGLYNLVLTFTTTATTAIDANNVVYGLVDAETKKWVILFTVSKDYIYNLGLNSSSGAMSSFSGAVKLTQGKKYYFGITENMKLLSNPSGNTGDGIGSYFALELLRTT